MEKYNLVISGSGTALYLHVGAYLELYKDYGKPNKVIGTSGGSIISSFIACGYSPNDILSISKELDLPKLSDFDWNIFSKFGFIKGELITKKLFQYIPYTFREAYLKFKIPLVITVTNLTTGEPEYYSYENTPDEKIINAIRSSISIPVLFKYCVNSKNEILVDGGLCNNFPIDFFKEGKTLGLRIISGQKGFWQTPETMGLNSFWDYFNFGKISNLFGKFFEYLSFCLSLIITNIEQKHIEDSIFSNIISIKTNKNSLSFNHNTKDIEDMINQGKNSYLQWRVKDFYK